MKDSVCSKYLELITTEYAGLNLTRILNKDEFEQKQWTDSLLPIEHSEMLEHYINETSLILDIGFGGGFPLLPMAEKFPHIPFHGFEARSKKVKAVQEIANKLELTNVFTHHIRIEDLYIDRKCVVFFKAVGKVNDFLSKINTSADILVYFFKGPNFEEQEKDQLRKALHKWERVEDFQYELFDNSRRIIGFAPKKVPRGTKPSKNLVNLSSIL